MPRITIPGERLLAGVGAFDQWIVADRHCPINALDSIIVKE
ncbi:MAG TPA: hypothetical protein VGG97_25670 [Bryobacteraceae bacterium]